MTRTHRLAALAGAAISLAFAGAAHAASDITVNDTLAYPESISMAADGAMIMGSSNKPVIYRAAPGATSAEPWIHIKDGATTLGILADSKSNTLYACQIESTTSTPPGRKSTLLTFDLKTGKPKASYPLDGAVNLCNDVVIGKGGVAYISDTVNGSIVRLKPGGQLETWLKDPALAGIDGITTVKGELYANSVTQSTIVRVPMNADGSAGTPVVLTLSQPVGRPDGMRAQNGRLFVAENAAGKVSELKLEPGDKATVVVLKDGYITPTAVEPIGDTLWVGEAKMAYKNDPKLKGQDPGQFKAYALPIPK